MERNKLKHMSNLDEWRRARKKYMDKVKDYCEEHGVSIKPASLKSCVDPDLWRTINQNLLKKEHLTTENEEPNNAMVERLILGKTPYDDKRRAKSGLHESLRSVKFTKYPTGCTHLDRVVNYHTHLDKVIRKIPEHQKVSKSFDRMKAMVMQESVQPKQLS